MLGLTQAQSMAKALASEGLGVRLQTITLVMWNPFERFPTGGVNISRVVCVCDSIKACLSSMPRFAGIEARATLTLK